MFIPFAEFAGKASVPFVPRSLWPEFPLEMSISQFLKPVRKGQWVRYGFPPFILHVYIGDEEPKLLKRGFIPRFYVWDKVTKHGSEKGWKTVKIPQTIYAVAYFEDEESFFGKWSSTYRWKRNRWLKERGGYIVEEVSAGDFLRAYEKSSTHSVIPKHMLAPFKESIESRCASKLVTHSLLVKDKETGSVLAGATFEYSLSTKNTHYLCGFIQDHREKRPVMIGLFNEWVKRGELLQMKWYNYGVYVHKGTDKGREGFSQFKSGLGVALYQAPYSLIKMSW